MMKIKLRHSVLTAFLSVIMLLTITPNANASLCCTCDETIAKYMDQLFLDTSGYLPPLRPLINDDPTLIKTIRHIEGEFTTQKQWIVGVVWEDNVLPAMMMMADELINVGMKQMEVIGTFFDAKLQLEAQRTIQYEEAKIRKLYTPSNGMCEFATASKSLASTERRTEINKHIMAERSLARQLGRVATSAYSGNDTDKESRIKQFKENYCNPFENQNGMSGLCDNEETDTQRNRRNRDIDFVRFIDTPLTLNANFTNQNITHHEEDLLSMAANLYSHEVPRRPLSAFLGATVTEKGILRSVSSLQKGYMHIRALTAKRRVAENSFHEIAAMKTSGTAGAREYLLQVMKNLGYNLSDDFDPRKLLDNEGGILLAGEDPSNFIDDPNPLNKPNPSYFAQMEVLTKKMVQDPNFYLNLYEQPANVTRKEVSMQAIGLMQKFDIFKSYLRQEATVSTLLEIELEKIQEEIENEIPPST